MLSASSNLAVYSPTLGWIPGEVVIYLGCPFFYPTGSEVGAAIARGWEWDNVLRGLLQTLVPEENPLICEVGGNIGASLLEMLNAKPRARIVCFEPSERFRTFLELNIRLAGLTQSVDLHPYIVGQEPGTGIIHTDHTSGSVHALPHLTEFQTAKVTTLNHMLHEQSCVRFLKVDTDGGDVEVLRGGDEILKRDNPILFFEYCPALMRSDPELGLRWLKTLGYLRFICFDNLGYVTGVSSDCATVTQMARDHTYCDILTCVDGTDEDRMLRNQQMFRTRGTRSFCSLGSGTK